MTDCTNPRVLVLGVGNPLMGDEGVGPRVIEHLMLHYEFPEHVTVVDAGTMGFTILNLFREADAIIVVDAVKGSGQDPGTVVALEPDSMSANQVMHSLHDARLVDVLDAAKLMGLDPNVSCIGVEVAEIVHWKVELTPVVEAAVRFAAEAVVDRLAQWDVAVTAIECPAEGGADAGASDADAQGRSRMHRTSAVIQSLRTKDDVGPAS